MEPQSAPFQRYQCPGEAREISRAVHLGRLADFYPACRLCECRTDTGLLPPSQLKQLDEMFSHTPVASLLFEEGLVGIDPTDIHPRLVRRAAAAFASTLDTMGAFAAQRGTVLIGCDGRPATSELIAAAAEGLRMANVNVIEVGPATCGSFTHAMQVFDARGAMLLGNARSARREISLKFWGQSGQPLSTGFELTSLEQTLLANPPRTARTSGTLARAAVESDYLAQLAPLFHALRPLKVEIDCGCSQFWHYLKQLVGQVACQFVASNPNQNEAESSCDFRLWIDGDGETLRVWDEQGSPVSEQQLLLLLSMKLLREQGRGTIVVPAVMPAKMRKAITKRGGRVEVSTGSSRRDVHQVMIESKAILGGGANHRYWIASESPATAPTPDALRVLALLLNLLSESDEPLSRRLLLDF
jgi:phosphomannomutase